MLAEFFFSLVGEDKFLVLLCNLVIYGDFGGWNALFKVAAGRPTLGEYPCFFINWVLRAYPLRTNILMGN